MCLDDDPALIPGWGPVIADIARQVAHDQDTNPTWRFSVTDAYGQLLHHGVTRRRPTAREASFVAARDRTCRAPGCRRPAAHCDQDHRREHARGGPATAPNLCTLCRHHHRLRHERGYTHHQISLGTTLWHTPHGRDHIVNPDATLLLTGQNTTYPDPAAVFEAWSNPHPDEAPDHIVDANGPPPEAFDEPEDWTPQTWAALTERLVDWTPAG